MISGGKKRVFGMTLAILISFSPINIGYTREYEDIDRVSNWAIKDIIRARDLDVLEENEYLNPKDPIKRGEFVRLLILSLGLDKITGGQEIFKDVSPDNKYFDYINTSYEKNLVMGSGDLFKPDRNISREEMAAIIDRVLKLRGSGKVSFDDGGSIANWAKDSVDKVASNGIIVGSGNKFKPNDVVSKEMAVVICMRVKDFSKNPKIDKSIDGKNTGIETIGLEDTIKYLMASNDNPSVGSMMGDWSVLAIARSGENIGGKYFDNYYKNVEDYVKEKKGDLHRVKYTEYSRLILSLTSIGKDPQNIGGYDLIKPLTDFDRVIKQGINGPIWALIALDSGNYHIVKDDKIKNQTSRKKLIDFILDRQVADGGWNLGKDPDKADIDITAMAIQALSKYYGTEEDVKKAVDRGLVFLSKAQKDDGSFTSWDSKNSESIAQVIVATTSLGINPNQDHRFIKNGKSPIDALLGFKDKTGGFYHIKAGETGNGGGLPGSVDIMATDQALYALVAYNRLLGGKSNLYRMK